MLSSVFLDGFPVHLDSILIMAHPKSRISKAKGRKRRTHYKATTPTLVKCPLNQEYHVRHRAYWHTKESEDGEKMLKQLIYRGKVVLQKDIKAQSNTESE